jgi:hypothetical protein
MAKKKLHRGGRTFYLFGITPDFIYYIDPTESDETASTVMFSHEGTVISDNYFAYESLLDDIQEDAFTWESKALKIHKPKIQARMAEAIAA